ncbi:MAG: adenylate/guanylate cyclase domain-containing protein [Gammaproteobacteria bacterium]|nr:adenylate/guanylate cyclase domain-containing protein [Gammaproteobacteria bacterium]
MENDHFSRKLAVLLHADIVGSTSLVQENETLAHERIQDTFRRFSETIASHGGIAHEIRGDALVAEFTRASDAVSAAVDFQLANATHIEELLDEIRPIVRIGIAMGEVVIADNTVTGEGIVLAQRLEQLAKPGSVCIQGAAYETVPKRLPFVYENLGSHNLKGFEEPINACAVRHESDTTVVVTKALSSGATVDANLSDKPSIAVLPFANMSGDTEQEYFSEGITEDIIIELSRFRDLYIIARNSTFTFKGQDVDINRGVKLLLDSTDRLVVPTNR